VTCAPIPYRICATQDAHVVLLLTEWPEFAGLSPGDLGSVVARRNIVDGSNALDPALWHTAGWNYRALGVAATRVPSRRSAVRQSHIQGRGIPHVIETGLERGAEHAYRQTRKISAGQLARRLWSAGAG
jgi:hypothetical protein